jgi:hypothetical protein
VPCRGCLRQYDGFGPDSYDNLTTYGDNTHLRYLPGHHGLGPTGITSLRDNINLHFEIPGGGWTVCGGALLPGVTFRDFFSTAICYPESDGRDRPRSVIKSTVHITKIQ